MKENAIQEKSYNFALDIIRLVRIVQDQKREFILTKQLIRSGTSIGANVRETDSSESKADFIHKLAIAQKECTESMYWIELLKDSGYIDNMEFERIHPKAIEIMRLITSIIKTAKSNLKNLQK